MKHEKGKDIISANILKYYGIYPDNEEQISEHVKKAFENIVKCIMNKVKVEQAYLCTYKDQELLKYNIAFIVDTHLLSRQYLEIICKELHDYFLEKGIDLNFTATTLAAFEIRNGMPTEEEYYIKKYGIKIFDSGKKLEILPKYMPLRYSEITNEYRYLKKYARSFNLLLTFLLRMYIQKQGYLDIDYINDISKYKPFISEITKDTYVLQIIDKFLDDSIPFSQKELLYIEFEKYVIKLKQKKLNKIKINKKIGIQKNKVRKEILKINETRLIKYKELINEKRKRGSLLFENLEKTELYELYIEEKVPIHMIAQLYDVSDEKIKKCCKKWNICYTQTIMQNQQLIQNILDEDNLNSKYDFLEEFLRRKQGIPKFMDLIIPILKELEKKDIKHISEIWKLTQNNYIPLNSELRFCISKTNPTLYYRASWCLNVLLRAKLIEKISGRYYEITDRGIEFLKSCKKEKIEKITIKMLQNKYEDYMTKTEISQSKKIKYQTYLLQNNLKNVEKINAKETADKVVEIKNINSRKITKGDNKKQIVRKHEYLEINKNNKILGDKCEEIIFEREKKILTELGRKDLAGKVKWVARDLGDGLGYDIKSYKEINGKYQIIYIEVKGTKGNCNCNFEITENEVIFSRKYKDRYFLYRLGKIYSEAPELVIKKGEIIENYDLEPVKYIAKIKE